MPRTKKSDKKDKEAEKELEKRIEKIVEKKINKFFEEKKKVKSTFKSEPLKIFGELIGYVIALIFLFVIFPRLVFVTSRYLDYLPIAFWTTTLGTLLKVFKHLSPVNAVKRFFEIGEHFTSLYGTYWFIVIFPLDFARVGYGQLNLYILYAMYFVILALAIAILVNFIRIFIPEKSFKI